VHPFAFAANIASNEHYLAAKGLITELSARSAPGVRYRGPGTRTFVQSLLPALLDAGARFYSLKELYAMSGGRPADDGAMMRPGAGRESRPAIP
jgi:hypothetical protein